MKSQALWLDKNVATVPIKSFPGVSKLKWIGDGASTYVILCQCCEIGLCSIHLIQLWPCPHVTVASKGEKNGPNSNN